MFNSVGGRDSWTPDPRRSVGRVSHQRKGDRGTNTVLCFMITTIAIFSTGCAAPLIEVVAKRQDGVINRRFFERGEKVWVTYENEDGNLTTTSGRVLHVDGDSVTLGIGWGRRIDLKYGRIHTLRRPSRDDRWFVGISRGSFSVLVPVAQEFPDEARLKGAGISLRNRTYLDGEGIFEWGGIETNFLVGGKVEGAFSTWLSISASAHFYTVIPGTYCLFGWGWVWPEPIERFRDDNQGDYERSHYRALVAPRIGFGVNRPLSKRYNIRIEAELIGVRVYFEHRLR